MRLWGGLIFRNGFRVVPPPVAGGAARFPLLQARDRENGNLSSVQCPHRRGGDVNTAQEAARAHQLLLPWPFL
jgi:hypothetical protein